MDTSRVLHCSATTGTPRRLLWNGRLLESLIASPSLSPYSPLIGGMLFAASRPYVRSLACSVSLQQFLVVCGDLPHPGTPVLPHSQGGTAMHWADPPQLAHSALSSTIAGPWRRQRHSLDQQSAVVFASASCPGWRVASSHEVRSVPPSPMESFSSLILCRHPGPGTTIFLRVGTELAGLQFGSPLPCSPGT